MMQWSNTMLQWKHTVVVFKLLEPFRYFKSGRDSRFFYELPSGLWIKTS